MANRCKGTLYVGITKNLPKRVYEHKNGAYGGFTARYGVNRLVWYEGYDDIVLAIQREKRLKAWKRNWKIRLVEESNPHWDDLSRSI